MEIIYLLLKKNPNNKDLLFAGIILHDLGKTVELSGPIATEYTLEGKLIGHISIMVSEIRAAGEKLNIHSEVPMLLQHMILSHHGEKDFEVVDILCYEWYYE